MAKGKSTISVAPRAIDRNLNDLFESSAGPRKAPATTRYSELLPVRETEAVESKQSKKISKAQALEPDSEEAEDDEDLSEPEDYSEVEDDSDLEDEGESEDHDDSQDGSNSKDSDSQDERSEEVELQDTSPSGGAEQAPEELGSKRKDRKRKRTDEHHDLESKYLRRLADDVPAEKRQRDKSTRATKPTSESEGDRTPPPVHESKLEKSKEYADMELDKANRTLFLGNVSCEAITSSKAKKTLMAHLASHLPTLDASSGPHKVESLRFRSTAFAAGGVPKRAAYITKSLMPATTKSTNAYVVYTTAQAARAAVKALNGTVVLERHLRADSVAHPTPTDHRRCVFVGNLGFVDDETVLNTNADGETKTSKRTKTPADFEEGLWRIFNQHAGKVESVRIPRDPKTRVGKGFAYVQFHDGNDVESALLLDGKKFPPMLPRLLRVSRAKDPRKTSLAMQRTAKARLGAAAPDAAGKPRSTKYKNKATPEQQSLAGRAGRLLGRAGAARQSRDLKIGGGGGKKPRHRDGAADGAMALAVHAGTGPSRPIRTPEQIVFEGRRARADDGKPKDLKFNKGHPKKASGGGGKHKTSRGARRAEAWKGKAK